MHRISLGMGFVVGNSSCRIESFKGEPKSMQALVIHPLEPVYDHNSRILILGTMPSVKSREAGFYYMHPQNRFWPVLAEVLGEPAPTSLVARRELALRRGVALWDVLASCEIDGSLDGTIRNPVSNDFSGLLACSRIRAIFTTGKKAADLYRRLVRDAVGMDCIPLPSSSPANRNLSDSAIREAYRSILPFLEDQATSHLS